ncbi:hypothetical protein BX666DRAFT_1975660 [Dichotomocladium elegans]|nr:hypothetical protein BX666DRAFT_1975660 [Dichotomocladium elegans]
MDPLVLYVVKRTVAAQHDEESLVPSSSSSATPIHIFKVDTWPLLPGDRVPKLRKENLLSLVFHAEEQWLESVRQSDDDNPETIDAIHRQQQIFLAALSMLHKSVSPNNRRFPESVWFTCQVLSREYHVKYLESMTPILRPPAHALYGAMRAARQCVRELALARKSAHPDELPTVLDQLVEAWNRFESLLYKSYGGVLLGITDEDQIMLSRDSHALMQQDKQSEQQPRFLPPEFFGDAFTQLLPLTLDRSLSRPQNRPLITRNMLEDLEPNVFLAVPRLSILAGMTWLSHLSGWRRRRGSTGFEDNHNPWLSQSTKQQEAFDQLRCSCERLEMSLPPKTFLERYTQLEDALVQGRTTIWSPSEGDEDGLMSTVYQTTCVVADTLLTGSHTRSFVLVLRHLFASFVSPSTHANSKDDHLLSISENTVLDLAI